MLSTGGLGSVFSAVGAAVTFVNVVSTGHVPVSESVLVDVVTSRSTCADVASECIFRLDMRGAASSSIRYMSPTRPVACSAM